MEGLNKSEYNFKYCHNFSELMELKIKNNYLLFEVELCLRDEAEYSIYKNFWVEGRGIN